MRLAAPILSRSWSILLQQGGRSSDQSRGPLGQRSLPLKKRLLRSIIRDPQSAIPLSLRVHSRFKIFLQREVGAARPLRPTLGEEVGKMPTLLEDTGGPPMPLCEEAASPITHQL
jgi:hypothetical protein